MVHRDSRSTSSVHASDDNRNVSSLDTLHEEQPNFTGHDTEISDLIVITRSDELGEKVEFRSATDPVEDFSQFETRSVWCILREITQKLSLNLSEDQLKGDVMSLANAVQTVLAGVKSHGLDLHISLEALREEVGNLKNGIVQFVNSKGQELDRDFISSLNEERTTVLDKMASYTNTLCKINEDLALAQKICVENEKAFLEAAKVACEITDQSKLMQKGIDVVETSTKSGVNSELKSEEQFLNEEEDRKQLEAIKEMEQKKLMENQALEEAKRKREEERIRQKMNSMREKTSSFPLHVFESQEGESEFSILCIVRAPHSAFDASSVDCRIVDLEELNLVYSDNEEVVSPGLDLCPKSPESQPKDAISLCIPFVSSRLAAQTRESVVKFYDGATWHELYTKEVSLDSYKEYRFVQAEIKKYGQFVVVSRLKRDTLILDSNRSRQITSSADHRASFSAPAGVVAKLDRIIIQVQPVDNNSLSELKMRNVAVKDVLTSSPIIHIDWAKANLKAPLTIVVPCPPNPATVKKLMSKRGQRDTKLLNNKLSASAGQMSSDHAKKKSRPAIIESSEDGEEKRKTETRWYMGIYGAEDENENDSLVLLQGYQTGRWSVNRDILLQQPKPDQVQFEMPAMFDKFIILRMRAVVGDDDERAVAIATAIDDYLSKHVVALIFKQSINNPFDGQLHIVPERRVDQTLRSLQELNYSLGPSPSKEVLVKEGDLIEIEFHGNIGPVVKDMPRCLFKSHLKTSMQIKLTEINQYLQKNFDEFHGSIHVYRKFPVLSIRTLKSDVKSKSRKVSTAVFTDAPPVVDESEDKPAVTEYNRELLCEMVIHLPKIHLKSSSAPETVNVVVGNSEVTGILREISADLRDDWLKLAHHLNVERIRVQAIKRNALANESGDEAARFTMLTTWWKRMPHSMNKIDALSRSLEKCGRHDLAVRLRLFNKPRIPSTSLNTGST